MTISRMEASKSLLNLHHPTLRSKQQELLNESPLVSVLVSVRTSLLLVRIWKRQLHSVNLELQPRLINLVLYLLPPRKCRQKRILAGRQNQHPTATSTRSAKTKTIRRRRRSTARRKKRTNILKSEVEFTRVGKARRKLSKQKVHRERAPPTLQEVQRGDEKRKRRGRQGGELKRRRSDGWIERKRAGPMGSE